MEPEKAKVEIVEFIKDLKNRKKKKRHYFHSCGITISEVISRLQERVLPHLTENDNEYKDILKELGHYCDNHIVAGVYCVRKNHKPRKRNGR